MQKQTFLASMAIGALAASNIGAALAQQGGSTGGAAVISAAPIYSESMVSLKLSAQRLREAIQSLAQKPPGSAREQAMNDARRALFDTQQAMVRLPAEYRVSGMVLSNVPIAQSSPAQNRGFGDSVKELQLAADRLRDAIQAMAQAPAGANRDGAVKQAHAALMETQQAMVWVPGYPSRASAQSRDSWRAHAQAGSRAQGTVATEPGAGSIRGGMNAGSDGADVQASVPAVAGGVGLNARAMLSNEARPDHNVKMVFSLNTGNYLADVGVQVKDRSGRTVIDGVSEGPWLYAKLPPGTYTATATYNGQSVSKQFSTGRSGQRTAHFRWPASVEQAQVSGVSPILGTGPQESR